MKSTRRHELQTNELADQLGVWIEKVRPHLATAGLVIVAAAALLGAWYYWASSKEYLVSQAWRTYMVAGTNPQGDAVNELEAVAENFKDTQAGLWAAQTAADIQAGQGVRMLFEDTAKAEDYLQNAISGYRAVLDNKLVKKSPMLQQRAHYGLAQALEATGKLDEAAQHYETIVQTAPKSALGKVAQRHVERLSRESTRQWYVWFDKQVPAPPASDASAGDLGAPASDLETLPEGPAEDFMKSGSDSGTPDAAAPAAEAPQPKDTPAAESGEPAGPALNTPATEPAGTDGSTGAGPANTPAGKTEAGQPAAGQTDPDGGQ